MKRILLALLFCGLPLAAEAEDAAAPKCGLDTSILVNQDQGMVTIVCAGITPEFGTQLADVLSQIISRRLDPQAVADKLDEIEPAPEPGVARELDEEQRQTVIKSLVGKAPQQIAIAADPAVEDGGGYGKSIATPLMMVGWQIEGNQIKRKAMPGLDAVRGVALIVRDPAQAPGKARELKSALSAAHVVAPILADPSLAADATLLWIGKRPEFSQAPKS